MKYIRKAYWMTKRNLRILPRDQKEAKEKLDKKEKQRSCRKAARCSRENGGDG